MKINFKVIKEASLSKLLKIEAKLRTEVVDRVPSKYLLAISRLLEVNRELLRRECKELLRRAALKTGR